MNYELNYWNIATWEYDISDAFKCQEFVSRIVYWRILCELHRYVYRLWHATVTTSGEQHWVCPSILRNSLISSSGSSPFSHLYSTLFFSPCRSLIVSEPYSLTKSLIDCSPPAPNTGLSQRSELCGLFPCQQSCGKLQSGRNLVEMTLHPKKR